MPQLFLDTRNRTASTHNAYTDLAQPIICGGKAKGSSESSSIESMGGSGGADAPKKSWTQRFFDSASKLCCVGAIFKMIAGWFNIQVEGNEGNNNGRGVDRSAQAKAKATIKKIFAKREAPSDNQIVKAKAEFKKLSLYGKLLVIQQLLNNDNCTSQVALSFIQMLGKKNGLAKLEELITKELGANSQTTVEEVLKKCKNDDTVSTAVAKYLEEVEVPGVKLITNTFSGKGHPEPKALKQALDTFRALESPVAQLSVLVSLFENANITDSERAEFFAALPKGAKASKAADESDDEAVKGAKGKKGTKTKKKEEVESDFEEEEGDEVQSDNIQARLLGLVKELRRKAEEEAAVQYKQDMEDYRRLRQLKVKELVNGQPLESAKPTKPHAFKNLKDYVNASASDLELRLGLMEQTKALLETVRREQGDGGDEE